MAEPRTWLSVLAGVGVSVACALVWWGAAAWARRGDSKRFMAAHLGGIGVRLALAGGLTAWALVGLDLRPGPFVLALLGSYTLLLALEVLWMARRRRPLGGASTTPNGTR